MKNPDGSLAQSAMMQSALAKERREQKMLAREQEVEAAPAAFNKNWIDPLPEGIFYFYYIFCPFVFILGENFLFKSAKVVI